MTKEEVSVARSAEMSVYPQMFDTPSSIVGALSQLAVYHLPNDYYQTYLAHLQATQPQDAAQALAKVVALPQLHMLIVGDRQAIEPKLKDAGFDKIEYLDSDGHEVAAENGQATK